MDTFELIDCLHLDRLDTKRARDLGHGSVIRGEVRRTPVVAIGGERTVDTRVQAFVDALHWHRRRYGARGPLRFVLGSGGDTQIVSHAIASLLACLPPDRDVRVEIDLDPGIPLVTPDFPLNSRRLQSWQRALTRYENTPLPEPLQTMEASFVGPMLQWYRSPAGGIWVGRVGGLRVASWAGDESPLRLALGRDDEGRASLEIRQRFHHLVGKAERTIPLQDLKLATSLLLELARERADYRSPLARLSPSSHLEWKLLTGQQSIHIDQGPLTPVEGTQRFRLPTLWSPDAQHHSLDLLLRQGSVPWAVEVDVPQGGFGQTIRRAMRDAALHRTFIRTAEPLSPWFKSRGLDHAKCIAAVAFPAPDLRDPATHNLYRELHSVAADLDVGLIALPPEL